jgi:GNAT superfamily N-acetyltransferase
VQARLLGPDDADALVAVVRDFKRRETDAAQARRFLGSPANLVFTVEESGETLGWLLAHPLERVDRDSAKLLIYEVETREAHRRRGVGRALVEAALAHARAEGMMGAWVLTNDSNAAALALYRATGARRPHEDDAMLSWSLSEEP